HLRRIGRNRTLRIDEPTVTRNDLPPRKQHAADLHHAVLTCVAPGRLGIEGNPGDVCHHGLGVPLFGQALLANADQVGDCGVVPSRRKAAATAQRATHLWASDFAFSAAVGSSLWPAAAPLSEAVGAFAALADSSPMSCR